jgi:hypothetical protein
LLQTVGFRPLIRPFGFHLAVSQPWLFEMEPKAPEIALEEVSLEASHTFSVAEEKLKLKELRHHTIATFGRRPPWPAG